MDAEQFERVFEMQVELCRGVLIDKAKEYATEDHLHNFKKAAALQGSTPAQALDGMLTKHIVSIFDMTRSGKTYPMAVWDEKITDAMNYLFLLKAIVEEDRMNQTVGSNNG